MVGCYPVEALCNIMLHKLTLHQIVLLHNILCQDLSILAMATVGLVAMESRYLYGCCHPVEALHSIMLCNIILHNICYIKVSPWLP